MALGYRLPGAAAWRIEQGASIVKQTAPAVPLPPRVRLNLGITGHRAGHPSFAANADAVSSTLAAVFDMLVEAAAAAPAAAGHAASDRIRLHSLLANGTDQVAATLALARGWELVAPLPFDCHLNEAINALPVTVADARALIEGGAPADPTVAAHAQAIRTLSEKAQLFELADRSEFIAELYLSKLAAPADFARAQLFAAETSVRVALAGRILIEQSDILVGVWDGVTTAHVGGTGHTIAAALEMGAPVIWIDPARPAAWRVLRGPEALATLGAHSAGHDRAAIATLVRDALFVDGGSAPTRTVMLDGERWHGASHAASHAYRRIEALFGGPASRSRLRGLRQVYETPAAVGLGSGAPVLEAVRALPGTDPVFAGRIEREVMQRFAWADGISAWLSDAYRGGMIVNFLLSSLAIVGGTAYLPLVGPEQKWGFALFELALLLAILFITWFGTRQRWHSRWFETRRVAEYLRHAPLMLILGASRAPGRWPSGTETSWPEFYARHAMRDVGLPAARVTPAYLRAVLTGLLAGHVREQRDYHTAKAARLTRVHHNLDRASTFLFQLAVASVAIYLALRGAAEFRVVDPERVAHASKLFTVLGVMFPTFGAGIAGIRYFGDFERFAAISEVTAQKLGSVLARIELLAQAPASELHYGRVAELAHATDDIVFAEIENWQSVFGGKQITVPV